MNKLLNLLIPIIFLLGCVAGEVGDVDKESKLTPARITSFSPIGSDTAGGVLITIAGKGFIASDTKIFIGGSLCSAINVINSETLNCLSPAQVAGSYDLIILNEDNSGQSLASAFTYAPNPTYTSISPTGGPEAGGTLVTITGTNFSVTSGANVVIGSAACTGINVVSATSITCTTSANTGTQAVTITNLNTEASTTSAPAEFTYASAPTVTSITPNAGAVGGGSAITITGTNFVAGATLSIAGVACTAGLTVTPPTTITCTTADSGGVVRLQGDVVVTNPDIQTGTLTNGYTYQPLPTITGILAGTPSAGSTTIGGTLTIEGTGFDDINGVVITVDGNTCTTPSINLARTQITCTKPAGAAGAVNIAVTNQDAETTTITAGGIGIFTYFAPMTLVSVAGLTAFPEGSVSGSSVTLTGTNFDATNGVSVTFDTAGTPVICGAPTLLNATTITCPIPAHAAGAVNVQVINNSVDTAVNNTRELASPAYTFQLAPSITSITPRTGAIVGGATIIINGINFISDAATSVTIDGNACPLATGTPAVDITPISIACILPAATPAAAGSKNIVVTNRDAQTDTVPFGFTYTDPPTIVGIAPSAGITIGGNTVTITGTNFDNIQGVTVTIGGITCISPVASSTTSITCTTGSAGPEPTALIGAQNVIVTNQDAGAQSVTGAALFTYQDTITLATISPTGAAVSTIQNITITGTNFYAGVTATVNGAACSNYAYGGLPTSFTCDAPAIGSEGLYDIVATNTGGAAAVLVGVYSVQAAPSFTSVTLDSGRTVGGDTITISGDYFKANMTVSINGSACTTVTISGAGSNGSGNQATCVTPANAAATYALVLTNTDGQVTTTGAVFTYRDPPTITSIAGPTAAQPHGPASTSHTVTIIGTNLFAGGSSSVTIGGTACSSLTVTNPNTEMTCTLNIAAGSHAVVYTSPNSYTDSTQTYYTQIAPAVTSLSDSYADLNGGDNIVITATNLISVPGNVPPIVYLDGATVCVYVSMTAATVTCTLPDMGDLVATTHDITILNVNGLSSPVVPAGEINYVPNPTLSSITPNLRADTYNVTTNPIRFALITGTNFISTMSATINSVACLGASAYIDPTQYNCEIPNNPPAAGVDLVDVAVNLNTLTAGQTATLTNAFTYIPDATLGSVAAINGPSNGGQTITLTGTGFYAGANTVAINGNSCNSVTWLTGTTMSCVTQATAPGTYDIILTTFDGQVITLSAAYTFDPPPTITQVAVTAILPTIVSAGPNASGTAITITGTNFIGSAVSIGGAACTALTVVSTTSITCTTPNTLSNGAFVMVVTNGDAQIASLGSAFTFQPAPTVTTIAQTARATVFGGPAAGGTPVTITGTGFIAGATVTINGGACSSPVVTSSTTLTCITPASALGAQTAVVTNLDTQASVAAGSFTYQAAPSFTVVTTPASAILPLAGGTLVFTGANFINSADTIIRIGGSGGAICTPSGAGIAAGAIECTVPALPQATYAIYVENEDFQNVTSGAVLTIQGPPVLTSIDIAAGPAAGGTAIVITGSNFIGLIAANVTVGGSACTGFSFTATTINCTTPAGAAGLADIIVTNNDGQVSNTLVGVFDYRDAPTITAANCASCYTPTSGNASGGYSIVMTGTNFENTADTSITIGGVTCVVTVVTSVTSLTCTAGDGTAVSGLQNIVVTNSPDAQNGTLAGGFTYLAAPTVTSLSPSTGGTTGGTFTTITGTNFITAATVTVGGLACTSPIVTSTTTITCLTPANPVGAQDVIVTNPDAQNGTLVSGFTYTSMAQLQWQVGVASPNPPNPDPYGSTSINITHTFTLQNVGDLISSVITISVTGADSAAYLIGSDTCSGNTLASTASCTVQVTFLGGIMPSAAYNSANVEASATTGGTPALQNGLTGTVP